MRQEKITKPIYISGYIPLCEQHIKKLYAQYFYLVVEEIEPKDVIGPHCMATNCGRFTHYKVFIKAEIKEAIGIRIVNAREEVRSR